MKRLRLLLPLAILAQSGPPPKAPDVPAEHPNRVTPTGIDADDEGNIWSITGHTHFRPEGYEVVVFDAQCKNRRVVYNRTDSTIRVECGPEGGPVVSLGENFGKD